MFENVVVVDGKGHLVGRLASVVAKQLLCGQKVVVVRAEELNVSGSLFRNRLKYLYFKQKRCNVNPKNGPFHHRAPSRIFYRVVRGMIPHKTARGEEALKRLKVVEGVPAPYDRTKKMVVPQAIRNLRLKPSRKFCRLGDLSSSVGWKHDELIGRLESKRKVKSAQRYQVKKALNKLRSQAVTNVKDQLVTV